MTSAQSLSALLAAGLLLGACAPSTRAPATPAPPAKPGGEARAEATGAPAAGVARAKAAAEENDDLIRVAEKTVVDAPIDEVRRLLLDPSILPVLLPRLQAARPLGTSPEGDKVLAIEQGASFFSARYTVRVRQVGDAFQVWLDPRYPHDIEAAHALLVLRPLGPRRTELAFSAQVDLGGAPWAMLFRGRVRASCRATPRRLSQYVKARAVAPPAISRAR
ncbi:MAG TPA: SRPBCC family protein [Polyangiaceae bacterium]|nr:SRPBCC family protein [Polyangiaceae bacterium]